MISSEFKPLEWTHATNIYEVNIRQYTPEGTFNAFAKHLPRLKDMGVETFWFMPIHTIGLQNRKGTMGSYYSISDYRSINSDFGTTEDFKNLVSDIHQLGCKVILDWVANHSAWDHVWTKTDPEFFVRDEQGNFLSPYPEWSDVIKLNYENEQMKQTMIDDMKFWVSEFDIDGFRCDMAHLVPLDFWKEARFKVDATKPLFWLAETETVQYHQAFDASYAWQFLHMMEKYWKGEAWIDGLDHVLNKDKEQFPAEALRMYFTSNHDENSHSGSEYQRMGDAAKAFAVLCATWNGVPLIYSGQEMPNHKALSFFEKDVIEWTEHIELHQFYKTLLTLHKENPAMQAGNFSTAERLRTSADDKIFSFSRKSNEDEVVVVLNLSHESFQFSIEEDLKGIFKEIFSEKEMIFSPGMNFELDAWQWLVFEKQNN